MKEKASGNSFLFFRTIKSREEQKTIIDIK
jgi:hypothetical protein